MKSAVLCLLAASLAAAAPAKTHDVLSDFAASLAAAKTHVVLSYSVSVASDAPNNNKCFADLPALKVAVRQYVSQGCAEDASCDVALEYGYPIGAWCTKDVTSFRELFDDMETFNEDIGAWDTRKVTDMHRTFHNAKAFNRPIGGWDTSNVKSMSGMFYGALSFDHPIEKWDTSKVETMAFMFSNSIFNRPLERWDVSNVSDMAHMFSGNRRFDRPLGRWSISKEAMPRMIRMFKGARSFGQSLCEWGAHHEEFGIQHYQMFHGTACESESDPSEAGGAWCRSCADGSARSSEVKK